MTFQYNGMLNLPLYSFDGMLGEFGKLNFRFSFFWKFGDTDKKFGIGGVNESANSLLESAEQMDVELRFGLAVLDKSLDGDVLTTSDVSTVTMLSMLDALRIPCLTR